MKSIKVFNKFNKQRWPNKLIKLAEMLSKNRLYAEKMPNDEKYIDAFV